MGDRVKQVKEENQNLRELHQKFLKATDAHFLDLAKLCSDNDEELNRRAGRHRAELSKLQGEMKDLLELVQVLHEQIEDLSSKACRCGTSSRPESSGESSYKLAPVAKEEEVDLEYADG